MGVGFHAVLQRIFPTRDWTCVSYVSFIEFFTTSATWEACVLFLVLVNSEYWSKLTQLLLLHALEDVHANSTLETDGCHSAKSAMENM